MPDVLFSNKLNFDKTISRVFLQDVNKSIKLLPNETDTIRTTFKSDATYEKWRECCRQAIDCCLRNVHTLSRNITSDGRILDELNGDKCHATWDGMSCWSDTPKNTLAKHECQDHIYFFDFVPICKAQVVKQCFPNGTWYIRGDHEWSNYSNCHGQSVSIGTSVGWLQQSPSMQSPAGLLLPSLH